MSTRLVYVDIDHTMGNHSYKSKVAQNEKQKDYLGYYSYSKKMANFEVFHKTILSSINLLFLKSDGLSFYYIYLLLWVAPKRKNFVFAFLQFFVFWQKMEDEKRKIDFRHF
jgi:hypothetical protein